MRRCTLYIYIYNTDQQAAVRRLPSPSSAAASAQPSQLRKNERGSPVLSFVCGNSDDEAGEVRTLHELLGLGLRRSVEAGVTLTSGKLSSATVSQPSFR